MKYWVYENWRVRPDKALVHKETCHCCNNGIGQFGGTRPDNGKWHGPFKTCQTAINHARALNRTRTDKCKRCKPCSTKPSVVLKKGKTSI